MKTSFRFTRALALAAAMTAAAASQAASLDFTNDQYPAQASAQSTLSRAEVRDQTAEAVRKGELLSQGEIYRTNPYERQASSSLSRDEVRRDTMAAGQAGLLDNFGA